MLDRIVVDDAVRALFILERLEPYPLSQLEDAGAELAALLRAITPDVAIATRMIKP